MIHNRPLLTPFPTQSKRTSQTHETEPRKIIINPLQKELNSATESVESAALSLECVDNVERCDCLPLGVLSVGDGIADDTFKERLENTTGLFVDHCKNCES